MTRGFLGLVVVIAFHQAGAQARRQGYESSYALNASAGVAVPVGREVLAKGWSAGPTVHVGFGRHIVERKTSREFSLGAAMSWTTLPFDEAGFVRDVRPDNNTPTAASGRAASVFTATASARVVPMPTRISPTIAVELGFFESRRGNVRYVSSAGTQNAQLGSKAGIGLGFGLGVAARFGATALGLEALVFTGSSSRDESVGSGQVSCNSSGCGVSRAMTQVGTLRLSARRILGAGS